MIWYIPGVTWNDDMSQELQKLEILTGNQDCFRVACDKNIYNSNHDLAELLSAIMSSCGMHIEFKCILLSHTESSDGFWRLLYWNMLISFLTLSDSFWQFLTVMFEYTSRIVYF